MRQQKFAQACVAFESSHQLEPSISTLLNHADCREKNAQLATALRLFADAERQTHDQPDATLMQLNAVAAARISKLQGRVSRLSTDVAPDNRIDGLEILRDADRVDPGAWNYLRPIDGGTHKITARAPSRAEWSTTVVVKPAGDIQVITIPKLAPLTTGVPQPDKRPPAPLSATSTRAMPTRGVPGTERLRAPVLVDKPLSGGLALALSLGGTVASWGLLIGGAYLGSDAGDTATVLGIAGGLGLILAPSFGHWYAGRPFTRGMGMRLAAPPTIVIGFYVAFSSLLSDSDGLSALGGLLTLTGAGLYVAGTVDDILAAPGCVRQRNRKRGLTIAPIVTPNAGGFALGGRF